LENNKSIEIIENKCINRKIVFKNKINIKIKELIKNIINF
jgi:hypothetical protein